MSDAVAPVSSFASFYTNRAWRLSLAILAVLAGVFLLYRPSSGSLVEIWNDLSRITYSHGFVIAALAAWLLLRRRQQLAELPWAPSLAGAVLTVLAGLLWFLAVRAGIEVIHQMLLVALMVLTVWAMFGLRMARVIWLPVAFLLLAVPVWDVINPLLQEATVIAVQAMLKVAGIPAYVEGNDVHVAAGVFEVAGGCSGIHFFIVSIALGVLYGEIGRDTLKVRALLLAMAIGFGLLTNWLRVFIIVVAGRLTDMRHWLIQEHYYFGWVMFAVMMLIYLLIARHVAPPERDSPAPSKVDIPAGAKPGLVVGLIALLCSVAAPAMEMLMPATAASLPVAGASLPRAPAHWKTIAPGKVAWNPAFTGADLIERGEYAYGDERSVEVFVATYALQRQNKELVAYGNSLVKAGEGVIVETRDDPDGPAREITVDNAGERSLIRYYYRVGEHRTARGLVAEAWYGISAFRGGAASSIVALRTACVPDCESARKLLTEFSSTP